jgi:hypothetical protein
MSPSAAPPRFRDREEAFHRAAVEKTGLDDFGDPSYREALGVLLDAYDREARLTPLGRAIVEGQIAGLLEKRLQAEKMWKETPAVLERPVQRPIVILGLVRTGSTALHYLMGQDPGRQSLEYWLAQNPRPRPPRGRWESYTEYRQSVAEIDAMYQANPALKAIHFMRADLCEECRHLLAQSFTDDGFEVTATVPSYSAWYEEADLTGAYVRHRKLVQLIGADDPRPWLLKYPVHMRHLDVLLSIYPDACIVWTHRDPSRVLRSYASLVAGFRALYEEGADRRNIARTQLEIWAAGAERAIAVRRQCDPAQFYDLHLADFVADPVGSVERIYRHFGCALSDEGRRRLAAWQADNPEAKHGRHEYAGEDLGLGDDEIRERFSGYMEYFDMAPEERKAT